MDALGNVSKQKRRKEEIVAHIPLHIADHI